MVDPMAPARNRLEEGGAQRGRQRQGKERREENRDRQRHRELAVDPARGSGEERHRHEHRDQHQGDADDRSGDLAHRLARGFKRGETFLAHDTLDILDHDDGVIDQNPDRQHHAEQRQNVDRKAEQPQTQTRACKRNRHHQSRDQRRPPALQEQVHDEENQHHRLDQRLDHFVDRGLHERRGVVGDRPADVVRQAGFQLGHAGLHALGRGERIGPGAQLHRHPGHRRAVQCGGRSIALRTDLNPGHLTQPHHSCAGICAQDDVLELFDCPETAFAGDRGVDLLAGRKRLSPDRAARDLCILFADRVQDSAGRKVV